MHIRKNSIFYLNIYILSRGLQITSVIMNLNLKNSLSKLLKNLNLKFQTIHYRRIGPYGIPLIQLWVYLNLGILDHFLTLNPISLKIQVSTQRVSLYNYIDYKPVCMYPGIINTLKYKSTNNLYKIIWPNMFGILTNCTFCCSPSSIFDWNSNVSLLKF